MSLKGKVLITGGAGYLGKGIIRRAKLENWPCSFTVFSRDDHKHALLLREFPEVLCIRGDVAGDLDYLSSAMMGHDIVIHAGASKHVDLSELNVSETIRSNIYGTENVAKACIRAKVKKALLTSTDKACHPVNLYGTSKLVGERLFQEYDRLGFTEYHITRYGNVTSSTGSVLTVWQKMLDRDGFVTATDRHMSRFWMSIDQAVDCVLASLNNLHGTITIPKCKALDMRTFAAYTMPGVEFKYSGLRPGEKRYEELITREEAPFVSLKPDTYSPWDYFTLFPVIGNTPLESMKTGEYRSDNCDQLTKEELEEMLK